MHTQNNHQESKENPNEFNNANRNLRDAMTLNKEQTHENEVVVTAVPDMDMITAIGIEEKQSAHGGAPGRGNEAPIPLGHSRFYCSKCRSVREEKGNFRFVHGKIERGWHPPPFHPGRPRGAFGRNEKSP